MKLTNSMKDVVIKKATDTAHNHLVEAAESALAKRCIEWLDQNGWKRSADIPAGFERYITQTNTVYIPGRVYGQDSIRVPVSFCDHRTMRVEVAGSAKDWPEWKAYFESQEAREEFKKDVRAVLAACQTVKHLQDTAPELAAFLPEPAQVVGALVAVETINKVRQALAGGQV